MVELVASNESDGMLFKIREGPADHLGCGGGCAATRWTNYRS